MERRFVTPPTTRVHATRVRRGDEVIDRPGRDSNLIEIDQAPAVLGRV